MTAAAEPGPPQRAAPDPVWVRRTRVTQAAMLVVIVLAAAVELIRMINLGAPVGGYVALAAAVAGTSAGFRRPVTGLVLVAAAPLTATLLGWDPLVTWTIGVFAALILTVRGLSGTLVALVVGAANLAAAGLSRGTIALTDPTASVAAFAAVAAAAIGSAMLGQLQYVSELHQRTHDAVAARRAAVDRGVARERMRIARDLHDGLGHRIAVLSMRLGAAEVHLPLGAVETRSDLDAARADLQAVLAETQQILRILHVDDHTDHTGSGGAPVPEHARIPHLVATFRDAGLEVDTHFGDLTRPLTPQTSTAAYRIAQEMLTNAQRHGTGPVSLQVYDEGTSIVVEAVNAQSAAQPTPQGTGFGLIGLSERAASAGGRLDVLPDGDLFRVRAVLPTSDDHDSGAA